MGLTERQAQAQLHAHALEEEIKASLCDSSCIKYDTASGKQSIIDYFNAVEKLHKLEIYKIIPKLKTDARWANVPRFNKPPSKISVYKLLRGLPMHIIGCLIAKQPTPNSPHLASLTDAPLESSNCYEHVNKAFGLMCTLSEMCVELPPLREDGTLGPDPEFTSELIDAVNMALLAIAGPEADTLTRCSTETHTFSQALCRAEIVPAALRALALITSAHVAPERGSTSRLNWTAVCEAIFTHPRGAIMIDAAFEACRVLIRGVRVALCSASVDGDLVYSLAYAAGGSLELITGLCSAPLFYHRMMIHDIHGSNALRLVLACLAIHDEPLAAPPFSRVYSATGSSRPVLAATQPPYPTHKGQGAAELLAARGFALLLLLGEYDAPMYLDEVFSGQGTKALAEQLVGRSAAYVGQVLLRPPSSQFPPATSEGQMAINVLRAAELLSDDSNFRVALIPGLAPTLAQLLAHSDASIFASMWCLGEEAVSMQGLDSNLLVNSVSKKALEVVDKYAAASKEYHAKGLGMGSRQVAGLPLELHKMGRHLALERSILLSKLLVNLHYYDASLPKELENSFLHALVSSILTPARDPNSRVLAMHRAAVNMENLFAVAWAFGPPDALKKIELMAEVDMEQSKDLLEKMKMHVENVENSTGISGGGVRLAPQNSPLGHGVSPQKQQAQPASPASIAAKNAAVAAAALAADVGTKGKGAGQTRAPGPPVQKIKYLAPVQSNGAGVTRPPPPQQRFPQAASSPSVVVKNAGGKSVAHFPRAHLSQFPGAVQPTGPRPPPPRPPLTLHYTTSAQYSAMTAFAQMVQTQKNMQAMQVRIAAQQALQKQQEKLQQQGEQLQQQASTQEEKTPPEGAQHSSPPSQDGA